MSNLETCKNQDLDFILNKLETTSKELRRNVRKIQEWLKTQSDVPEIMEEKYIENFLIFCKCNMEKTKQKIKNYYKVRTKLPDFYKDINPEVLTHCDSFKYGYWVTLPDTTKDKYRVHTVGILDKNQGYKMNMYDFIKIFINVQEVRLNEDIIFGDIYIVDFAGVPYTTFLTMTPFFFKKCVDVIKGVYGLPLKGFYALNSPSIISRIFSVVKLLIKPKLFERFYFFPDDQIPEEIFPRKMLPTDFGGEQKCLAELREMQMLKFRQYKDRFDKLDKISTKG